MNVIQKNCYKSRRVLLGSWPIYEIAKARTVSGKLVELPNASEAFEILEAASPRPARCMLPEKRDWPVVPEIEGSVIVPCYNASKYVVECIESVLGQKTSRSFEVIAIDDGSTDETGALLDDLAAKDARVRVIHQRNRGFSGSRNAGISLARGGVLLFVDSDDILEPDALESLMRWYDKGGCDFVTASYSIMSEDGTKVAPLSHRRSHGAPWARVYSREVWRNLEFPEGFWFEDTVQAYCINSRFRERYIDQALYRYRSNGEGISAKCASFKKGLDTFWIVDEMLKWCHDLDIAFDQRLFDQTVRQLGPLMNLRTAALDKREKMALFSACCELLASVPEFVAIQSTSMGGRWDDLLYSLRTRNYGLWELVVAVL